MDLNHKTLNSFKLFKSKKSFILKLKDLSLSQAGLDLKNKSIGLKNKTLELRE